MFKKKKKSTYPKNPEARNMPENAPLNLTTKERAMKRGEAFLVMLSSRYVMDKE